MDTLKRSQVACMDVQPKRIHMLKRNYLISYQNKCSISVISAAISQPLNLNKAHPEYLSGKVEYNIVTLTNSHFADPKKKEGIST